MGDHLNGKQLRLKTQLHPRRPLLFIFCRQSVTAGYTSLELYNLEDDCKNLRFTKESTTDIIPNALYSFANDYYLNNESLEQNDLHFISKKFKGKQHEFVALFHKPEIEQNISSGSKLLVFDLTTENMSNFKGNTYSNGNYGHYYQYGMNQGNDGAKGLNFNTMIWNKLSVGQTYHHNLIDIFPRSESDENVLILLRIHHVVLLNQDNTPAPPQSLGQLDPNSNFNFESWSELYYVNLNLLTMELAKVEQFGFRPLPMTKSTLKDSNCVDAVKFSTDGRFFAVIKQREMNDEALFRIYRTGGSECGSFLCQMTNIDIKPWMIHLDAHLSRKFGHFFSISHRHDEAEKAWMILAGPNIHGDLQTYREILRDFIYDDAISVIVAMIGLSHRFTLHFDIGYFAGEQMADFDYNTSLDAMFIAVDDASYMLWQQN